MGDTYPGHTLMVSVKAYIYRWQQRHTAEGELLPYAMEEVQLSPAEPVAMLRCGGGGAMMAMR